MDFVSEALKVCESMVWQAGTIVVNFDRATLQGAVTRARVPTVWDLMSGLKGVFAPKWIFYIIIIG